MPSLNLKNLVARLARNWPAKALSVALAIVVFVFHSLSTLEERFFSVPLSLEGMENLTPSKPYPRMIRISLRGDADTIYPVIESDIEAYIDLGRFDSPGNYRAEVRIRKTGAAAGVQPLEINADPMDIDLSLDHKISKFVPLTAALRGSVESGYILNSYSLDMTQVIIDGPSALVGNISELYTDFIDLDGRTADFTATVNILNRDPLVVIRGGGTTVFRGSVSRIVQVRTLSDLPISVTGLSPGLSCELDIKLGSLHLEGTSQEAIESFTPPEDFLSVDCSGITERGTYILKVKAAALPPGLDLRYEPGEVTVAVENVENIEDPGGAE